MLSWYLPHTHSYVKIDYLVVKTDHFVINVPSQGPMQLHGACPAQSNAVFSVGSHQDSGFSGTHCHEPIFSQWIRIAKISMPF